jgi:hypothetical protein
MDVHGPRQHFKADKRMPRSITITSSRPLDFLESRHPKSRVSATAQTAPSAENVPAAAISWWPLDIGSRR